VHSKCWYLKLPTLHSFYSTKLSLQNIVSSDRVMLAVRFPTKPGRELPAIIQRLLSSLTSPSFVCPRQKTKGTTMNVHSKQPFGAAHLLPLLRVRNLRGKTAQKALTTSTFAEPNLHTTRASLPQPDSLKTFDLKPSPRSASSVSLCALCVDSSDVQKPTRLRPVKKRRNPAPFQCFNRCPPNKVRPFQQFQFQPPKPSAISTFAEQDFHTTHASLPQPDNLKTCNIEPFGPSAFSVSLCALCVNSSDVRKPTRLHPVKKRRNPAPFQCFNRCPPNKVRPFQQFQSQPPKPSAISTFAEQDFHTTRASLPQPENLKTFDLKPFLDSVLSVTLCALCVNSSDVQKPTRLHPVKKRRNPAPFQPFNRRPPKKLWPFQQFQFQPQKPSAISTFTERNFHFTCGLQTAQPDNLKTFNF
jgi:hypothetical protein